MANICLLGWLLSWLYFCLNSCYSIKSMQVSKDIFPIFSCSIILYQWDILYIPSINLNWIKSSSIVCSFCPSFSNSQYLFTFRRQTNHKISTQIFYDRFVNFLFHQHNFVLSATTNLFLGLIFLLMIWLIFSKVRSSRFVGYTIMETFFIALHQAVAKKRSVISFSPPFSLLSFSFLVLALAAKHCSHVLAKLVSSRDNWYPIGDAIVVMWKISTG